ncbi:MAG: SpoVG family protein [Lachnospiraceae bacterium]|nr:SpoVG family protein [Lachnospiraceae bacterium]
MNITNVKVTRVHSDSKLEAMASVTIDDAIKIQGFKVIAGEKGYFVAMPNKQEKNGEYKDTVYPVTAEARKELTEAVLAGFTKDRLEKEEAAKDPDPARGVKLPWETKEDSYGKETIKADKENAKGTKEKASVREQLAKFGKIDGVKAAKTEKTLKAEKTIEAAKEGISI